MPNLTPFLWYQAPPGKALVRHRPDPDRERAERARQALLKIRRIEVAELDLAAAEVAA